MKPTNPRKTSPSKDSSSFLCPDVEHTIAVEIVENYIQEYLPIPPKGWGPPESDDRSYERWAAGYILNLLKDNPERQADSLIEDYIRRLKRCYRISKDNRDTENMFKVAIYTANDILLLFL